MPKEVITAKNVSWHHISRVTKADVDSLRENFKFHTLDYDDIESETPISKMDTYKHYIFFIFHIPTRHKDTGHVVGEELYVFLSKDEIVTVSHAQLPVVDEFLERLQKSTKYRASMMGKGAAFLLSAILTEAFRKSLSILSHLTQEVSRLELEIQHEHKKSVTIELGHVRRNVLFLRHIIDPQRNMFSSLTTTKRSFIPENVYVYFDDVHDILDTMWLTSDNLKLIIDGLFDVSEALLSHKTNEIVTLLTITSASLMVPTLVAGFYGMNVPWLPYASSPNIVGFIYGAGFVGMIIIVVGVVRRPRS